MTGAELIERMAAVYAGARSYADRGARRIADRLAPPDNRFVVETVTTYTPELDPDLTNSAFAGPGDLGGSCAGPSCRLT